MAHVLILGMTESGKTTLARQLAAFYKRNSSGVLVLDTLRDPRWECDFITADPAEFLEVFWASRRCMAFIDEAGESVGRYDVAMQKVVTQGRHWGHSCHIVTQGATQLAPIVRAQCRHLFLFCSPANDGKVLSSDWNKPELVECANLKQGEYIHAVKFGATTRHTMGVMTHDSDSNSRRRSDAGSGSAGRHAEEESSDASTARQTAPVDSEGSRQDSGPGPGDAGSA